MPVATFDTLKFANKLKDAGVPSSQAEAQASAMAELLVASQQDLASKQDILLQREEFRHFREEINQSMEMMRQEMKQFMTDLRKEMAQLASDMRQEMKQLRTEMQADTKLTRWMFSAAMTVMVAILIRLFFMKGF